MNRISAFLALAILYSPIALLGQKSVREDPPKTEILLTHTGSDRVGQDFVYALKEEIRKSFSYRLVDSPSSLVPKKDFDWIGVMVMSMDEQQPPNEGHSSAISILITAPYSSCYGVRIVDQELLLVGSSHSAEMARSALAAIDHELDEARKFQGSSFDKR